LPKIVKPPTTAATPSLTACRAHFSASLPSNFSLQETTWTLAPLMPPCLFRSAAASLRMIGTSPKSKTALS
jgi:hypothetical protein